jgi:hypothetical protein
MLTINGFNNGGPNRLMGSSAYGLFPTGADIAKTAAEFGRYVAIPVGYNPYRALWPAQTAGGLGAWAYGSGQGMAALVASGRLAGSGHGEALVTAILTAFQVITGLASGRSTPTGTLSGPASLGARLFIGQEPLTLEAIASAVWSGSDIESLIAAIHQNLQAQVPQDIPAVVVPAPSVGQTTAWAACYDEHGLPEAGVTLTVKLCATGTATGAAFDGATMTAISNDSGIASLSLPRNAGLRFQVRRGTGPWVKFSGVDAATLELPAMLE